MSMSTSTSVGEDEGGGTSLRVLPVGDDALLVEVASGAAAEALHAELLRRRAAGLLTVREIVPAARTVLLDGVDDPARSISELTTADIPPAPPPAREVIEIPVRYDGPDLADVAAHWGVSEGEVARIHSDTEFRVAFCGFAPGFGYLTGLPARYDVPRRATPRTAVPAGSVALAGPYTGVYPRASPGGWQLIGRTDAVLWDPAREPAALLSPGTRVRFVATGSTNATDTAGPTDATSTAGPTDATSTAGPTDATDTTEPAGPTGPTGQPTGPTHATNATRPAETA